MSVVNAVKVEFTSNGKQYTYLLPKKLEDKVYKGDYLIVPAGYGDMPFKTVRVTETLMDFQPSKRDRNDYKYVVDMVNDTDYRRRQKAKEKSDMFTSIMNSLRAYCDTYDVGMFATTEREYCNLKHPTISTVITLTDDSGYAPTYFWETQH